MKLYNIFFIITIFIFCSCDNVNSKLNSKEKTTFGVDSLKVKYIENGFHFYPYKYVLSGIISTRVEYGPPNYGESPNIDIKERIYLITIDSLISIIPLDSLNEKVDNIKTFQIVTYEYDKLDSLIGKRISLKGSFYNAYNGHHHTAAIFDIN